MSASVKYKCPKCGGEKIYIKQVGNRTGLYCFKCNAWIKWLDYEEIYKITKGKRAELSGDEAVKSYSRFHGIVTVRCSNCRIVLYTSSEAAPLGQFNLINSSYCPNCGKKFI